MATRPPELDFFNISEIARLCRVSLKTARRWKDGQIVPPHTAIMVLSRDLGSLDPAWKGWKVWGDHLHSPEGWYCSQGEVLSVQFLQSQLSAWRQEAKQLRAKVSELEAGPQLEDQPLPSQWQWEQASG